MFNWQYWTKYLLKLTIFFFSMYLLIHWEKNVWYLTIITYYYNYDYYCYNNNSNCTVLATNVYSWQSKMTVLIVIITIK